MCYYKASERHGLSFESHGSSCAVLLLSLNLLLTVLRCVRQNYVHSLTVYTCTLSTG